VGRGSEAVGSPPPPTARARGEKNLDLDGGTAAANGRPTPAIKPKSDGPGVDVPDRGPDETDEHGAPPSESPPPPPRALAPQPPNGGERDVRTCACCGKPSPAADPLQRGHWRPRRPEGDWLHASCIGPWREGGWRRRV